MRHVIAAMMVVSCLGTATRGQQLTVPAGYHAATGATASSFKSFADKIIHQKTGMEMICQFGKLAVPLQKPAYASFLFLKPEANRKRSKKTGSKLEENWQKVLKNRKKTGMEKKTGIVQVPVFDKRF